MDSTKRPSAKCSNDAFRRCSSILSFVSILLIVALFVRMETINRKTKMNELRISDVESHLKIAVLMKRAGNEGQPSKDRYTSTCKSMIICFKEFGFIASSNLERFGFISAMQ